MGSRQVWIAPAPSDLCISGCCPRLLLGRAKPFPVAPASLTLAFYSQVCEAPHCCPMMFPHRDPWYTCHMAVGGFLPSTAFGGYHLVLGFCSVDLFALCFYGETWEDPKTVLAADATILLEFSNVPFCWYCQSEHFINWTMLWDKSSQFVFLSP